MSELRDEFLSEEDLDLRNLSREELIAYWNQWLEQAQATNHLDQDVYSHGVFSMELLKEGTEKSVNKAASRVLRQVLFLAAAAFPLCLAAQSDNINTTRVFPPDNAWNWDISQYGVHPNSANYVASVGAGTGLHPDFGTVWNGAPNGIPYMVVGSSEPLVAMNYTDYGDESDPGPFPIPLIAPVEGGPGGTGDRHVIAVDTANRLLYELFYAFPQTNRWDASCGARFDLASNSLRPDGWTSADAAGLPIFPGLVRYEDVYIKGEINHAIRFTVSLSQRAYIYPATHFASSSTDPNRPPMGLRFRLKAGYDISGFSPPIQVILRAFKKYGIMMADNGSNWYISGAPDDRWDDDVLQELRNVTGADFEAVQTVDANGDPILPGIRDRISFAPVRMVQPTPYPFLMNRLAGIGFSPVEDGRTGPVFDALGRYLRPVGEGSGFTKTPSTHPTCR